MLKKILICVIVALISFQIPLIVSISTSQKAGRLLEKYQKKAEKFSPVQKVGGLFSSIVNEIVVPTNIIDFPHMLSKGKSSLADAQKVIKHMKMAMYGSMIFIFLLLVLLFFLSRKLFIRNLAITGFISGILGLIVISLVYYFFVVKFDGTFKYFYSMVSTPQQGLGIPFVPGMIKSFSKKFISYLVNSVLRRNMICVGINISVGIALMFINKFVINKN
jgi:hypothetical protein